MKNSIMLTKSPTGWRHTGPGGSYQAYTRDPQTDMDMDEEDAKEIIDSYIDQMPEA